MKKLSLKKQLFNHLRFHKGEWLGGYELEDFGRSLGFKASNAGRRCRELAENSYYIKRKEEGGLVFYSYQEPPQGEVIERNGTPYYQPPKQESLI